MTANGQSPEVLFWVGCAGSFDDRAKRITKAIARILHASGTSFAVLGQEESCTGDPAKRAGNEHAVYPIDAQMAHHQLGAGIDSGLCQLDLSNVPLSDHNILPNRCLVHPRNNELRRSITVHAEPWNLQFPIESATLHDNPCSIKLAEKIKNPGTADTFCFYLFQVFQT